MTGVLPRTTRYILSPALSPAFRTLWHVVGIHVFAELNACTNQRKMVWSQRISILIPPLPRETGLADLLSCPFPDSKMGQTYIKNLGQTKHVRQTPSYGPQVK